jgi:ACR3 family arsenite efflux pump ArsB
MHTPTLGYADTDLTRALRPITQSGLLATVAAQLLTFFKADSNFKHPESAARDAILVFTYLSLMFSVLLSVCSILLKTTLHDSDKQQLKNYLETGPFMCAYGGLILSCDCGTLMQYRLQGLF